MRKYKLKYLSKYGEMLVADGFRSCEAAARFAAGLVAAGHASGGCSIKPYTLDDDEDEDEDEDE